MTVMLTTKEAVKEQLGIPTADTSQDSLIERTIKAASDAIQGYCNRNFKQQDYEHTFNPTYDKYIFTEEWPVIAVSKVIYGDVELDPAEYSYKDNKIIKTTGTWDKETVVEYTAGYILPGDEKPGAERDLPYDIEEAAIYYATLRIRTGPSAGIKSEQVDVLRVQYEETNTVGGQVIPLPPVVMSLVNPYRKVVI